MLNSRQRHAAFAESTGWDCFDFYLSLFYPIFLFCLPVSGRFSPTWLVNQNYPSSQSCLKVNVKIKSKDIHSTKIRLVCIDAFQIQQTNYEYATAGNSVIISTVFQPFNANKGLEE